MTLLPEREIPVSHVCTGDRLWHNGRFVEVTSADRAGNDIRLVCRVPDAPFDQLDFRDPTKTVTIEALPHAHRYWEDGALTEEHILQLIHYGGLIIQSKAGVYVAASDYKLIEGEWLYGTFPEPMAYYDPTITRDQARALLEPIFGRPLRITTISGGYLVAVVDMELDAASLPRLTAEHPFWLSGGDNNSWLRVSSLSIAR